jgi:predicted small metal-binding protein
LAFKFKCADIRMACGFETTVHTKEQLTMQIATHAKQVHSMTTIPTDVMTKVQAAIKQA